MKIKEVMNKAIAVESDISLKEAAKIMSDKNIGCLVVLEDGDIAGILSESDILKNIEDINEEISSVMNEEVITIEKDEELDDAAELMKKNKIKHLPVINNGKLVGIITATDLIANSDELNEDFLLN